MATKTYEGLPENLRGVKIPWGPIGEQVYRRTYSQVMQSGRKEQWPDTVVRAVDGNLGLVPEKFVEEGEREKLYEMLLTFAGLPAGRHLSASGMLGRQFLFNCHASGWDPLEPEAHFTFLFDALMMGGGVGSNYSNRYMKLLPNVNNFVDLHIVCRPEHANFSEFEKYLSTSYQHDTTFTETMWQEAEQQIIRIAPLEIDGYKVFRVPDTREGWVDAVGHALRTAFSEHKEGPVRVIVDVSPIRRSDLPLKTSGGVSCGPAPLVSAVSDMVGHLNGCEGRQLTSLDAMVIDHTLAGCVIAGGKRRSSRMSVKSWKDADIFEFIHCKRVDGIHWTTNISVEVDDDFHVAYSDTQITTCITGPGT
jgi:ribonucleoside-triphosphate reductase